MTPLERALWLAEYGLYVHPIRGKIPLLTAWQNASSNDPEVLESWGELWDRADGVGVNCGLSGICVVDVDDRDAMKGQPLTGTAFQLTRREGGIHLIYKAPTAFEQRGGQGIPVEGMDIRGAGSQIRYYGFDPEEPLAPWPYKAVISGKKNGASATHALDPADLRTKQGLRNDELYRYCRELAEKGNELADIYHAARSWAGLHLAPGSDPITDAEIWRTATSARGGTEKALPTLPLHRPTAESIEKAMAEPVRCIVPGLLYNDFRLISGPGSCGKTTLELYMALQFAGGFDCFGLRPIEPVRTLFITKEDSLRQFNESLGHMIKEGNWQDADRDRALDNIAISDWGELEVDLRLTGAAHGSVYVLDDVVNQLIDLIRAERIDHVVMDPLSSFTAGEGFGNDGMQGLVNAARRIRTRTTACVTLIHHSGEENAKRPRFDMYAMRGHSNIADGARMNCVYNAAHIHPALMEYWLQETGRDLLPEEAGIIMGRARLRFEPPGHPKLYIVRQGYRYEQIVAPGANKTDLEMIKAQRLADWIRAEAGEGREYGTMELARMKDAHKCGGRDAVIALCRLLPQLGFRSVHRDTRTPLEQGSKGGVWV
jgi:hypothetical protein